MVVEQFVILQLFVKMR